jgi:excisionase family DNA binding protein
MNAKQPRPFAPDLSDRLMLSIAETAQALGISEDTIRRAQKRGEFPKTKVGSVVGVPVEGLVVYLRNQTYWSQAPAEWQRLKSLAARWGRVAKQEEPTYIRLVRERA